jgi:hypothetical protein
MTSRSALQSSFSSVFIPVVNPERKSLTVLLLLSRIVIYLEFLSRGAEHLEMHNVSPM